VYLLRCNIVIVKCVYGRGESKGYVHGTNRVSPGELNLVPLRRWMINFSALKNVGSWPRKVGKSATWKNPFARPQSLMTRTIFSHLVAIWFRELHLLNLLTVFVVYHNVRIRRDVFSDNGSEDLVFICAQAPFVHLPTEPLPALQSSGFAYPPIAAESRRYFIRFAASARRL